MSLSSLSPLASLLPPGVSILQGLQLFFQVIQDTFTTNLVASAAVTWIGYDICLTFADEVELIWKARWTLPKFLYIAVRYYGFAAALFYFVVNTSTDAPFQLCRGWAYYEAFGATAVIVLLSEALFLLRIWIAYGRNQKILAFVLVCYVAEIASSLAVGIVEGRTLTVLPRPPGFPLPGCFTFAMVPLKHTLPAWIVISATSTSYLVLMVHQFVNSHAFKAELVKAKHDPLGKWFQVRTLSPLVYLLVRDGLVYFVMMFSASMLNLAITIHFNRREIQAMGVPIILAVASISASRLALNLRGATRRQRENSQSDQTTIHFELQNIAKEASARTRSETSTTRRPSTIMADV
ncbi:hypothetical protein BD311DRAFT_766065 [Dichomitus squalens]|uniref:DUF6533 domain-containing protein n=2 Tax=Dichomitus squalens TaxID=114155 RepID=A0A4Q9MBS3_9APHY|nr:hypothetical protein BD311DRAFT_766065 [Dichomitus squalens]